MKISIILPVYNAAKYIGRCIDSIIHQTYSDWECIVVDDGSTDGSIALVREYAAGDPRFIILELDANRGVASARNAALRVAQGDALCFVDADDWCEARMLEFLVSRAAAFPSVGRIFTPPVVYREGSGVRNIWYVSPFGLLGPDSEFPFADAQCDLGHVTGCLYVLRNIPLFTPVFPRVKVFEDMIFNMGLIFSGVTTLVCDVTVYNYTRRKGSLVDTATLSKADAILARAALNYLAATWEPKEDVRARCEAFLMNAVNGRMKRF